MKNLLFALFAVAIVALAAACGQPAVLTNASNETPSPEAGTLTIFAAASTTNALDEINQLFQKQTGQKVDANYAGSSALAQQIIAGAGADLFLSANAKWADEVGKHGLIARQAELLGNRLVMIAPAATSLTLATPEDLKNPAVRYLSLADPDSVPAGIYARLALVQLGLWDAVSSRVVRAGDVRQALAHVETGQADAGIVYATDAAISKKVRVTYAFDDHASSERIVYPIALLKSAEARQLAGDYYEFIQSPAARDIFLKYGFTVPGLVAKPQ